MRKEKKVKKCENESDNFLSIMLKEVLKEYKFMECKRDKTSVKTE